MKKYLFFALILLSAFPAEGPAFHDIFIIWNVGQGQWLTGNLSDRCEHFDFGGEKFPLNKIKYHCSGKENHLQLSHWDFDHWGGLKRLIKIIPTLCHAPWPPLGLEKKLPGIAHTIPLCKKSLEPWYRPETNHINKKDLTSNDLSQIFIFQNQILIPGDSTNRMEKIWAANLTNLETKQIKVLILGHHGSKTSTSEALLQRLPRLKFAIATARESRYGHPHFVVLNRLRQHRIPILRTEDWGHIGLEL
jgi:competence protein ComEC